MMKTLFLQPPSFGGFDGGAGSRYQAKREIRRSGIRPGSPSRPRWCPGSRLIDAPPANLGLEPVLADVKQRDLVVMHTTTPSFASDVKVAAALKDANPSLKIGFVGAKVAVQPGESLEEGAGDRLRRPQRVRLHLPGGRRGPRLRGHRRDLASATPTAPSSTTRIARSSRTWTSCRS